ncbi:MAG: hypothetical protein ACFE94_14340 [Candidatus Hodarchaeota archaeon]
MQNPEELAQEALKFLELAQNFEEEKYIEQAISNYQKAADYLKQSGYLMHRVNEIYERIEELKSSLKQEKLFEQTQIKSQAEQLQNQAFALLEGAKTLESGGYFEEAINQYVSAINLLNQSGWSETQLENLRLKIKNLFDILKKEQFIHQRQQKELSPPEEYLQKIEDIKPEVVGIFGERSSREKAESIARYRSRKKQEEETQNHAFAHIDKAKEFEKERKFDNAIMNYESAIELLNSIGWDEQTKKIEIIIEKLRKDKQQFEDFQNRQKQASTEILSKTVGEKFVDKSESDLKKAKLIEFEEKKRREEEIQTKAFNLIDIGKKFDREKDYEQAIQKFELAVELFKSIEWDSYIHPIITLIEDIKKKQERERKAFQLKEKREKDLKILQNSIYRRQEEEIQQTALELEKRRLKFEEERDHEVKIEKEFFKILSNADSTLQKKKYEEAIDEYQKALKFIEKLGSGWNTYVSNINNIISNIQKIENSQLKKKYDMQEKLEKREKEELEFQKQIADQLDKERKLLQQKEIILKDKEKEIIYLEQRKKEAFKSLDSAINYINQGDYDNAILAYQTTANIFAEIHWKDEIPLIENAIFKVEELRRNQRIQKQIRMQETIEKQKEEEAFQKQITQYLKQEREKIKKREIELKEREEELKFREERRETGFKLLEQAQNEVSEGNFDKAIEILQDALNFFAEAHWQNEISLIQASIIEIENKKREAELQAQIRLQAELEREKQEKEFQKVVTNEIKTRQERLKKEEIVIREHEKEIVYREKKKEEAFILLDEAQKLVAVNNYDSVLEIYYKVLNIFAQIQWKDEIPLLKEAIQDIEEKRRNELIFKQKQLQKSINKEVNDKAFIEKIKYQREREKQEALRDLEFKEKQKSLSAQNLAKQEEAFDLMEDGENLVQVYKYDEAIKNYQNAREILKVIGWGIDYLKLLDDTIITIQNKKVEDETSKQIEFELKLKHQQEEEEFQNKISEYLKTEQNRIKEKQIQLQKREEMLNIIEIRKAEAFTIMDEAENSLNQGQYNKSIEKYRQAELILNEIGYPSELIREMIQKIQERRREEELNRLKELELSFRKEQEDLRFQQQISEKVRIEKEKMREKQEELKKQEEIRVKTEKMEEKAFHLLEEAQTKIGTGEFDKAIVLYQEALKIFKEIHWDDEIKLIQNSIRAVEDKKREAELKKQKDLEELLEKEKLEKAFQAQIALEISTQQERLKQREIKLRKQEEELAFREEKKNLAFKLLDEAQVHLSQGNYDNALRLYNEVTNIFAQIQWVDEIPIIQEAINDIQKRKRKEIIIQQRELEKAIEEEKANYSFIEQINLHKELEKEIAMKELKSIEMQRKMSAQNLIKQQEAFKIIEDAEVFLKQSSFEDALNKYNEAINILTEIGWTESYLKLLNDTIKTIKIRKRKLELSEKAKQQLLLNQKEEEEKFQRKVYELIQSENNRLREKKVQIQKREDLLTIFERKKSDAFQLIENAQKALNTRQYEKAIEKYRQAELILYEIGFPTGAIKEMINKIQSKSREEIMSKQKDLEINLQKEREEIQFQRKIAENVKINEIKMKSKQKKLEKQRESYEYMERRKEEAFNLLEEAEIYMNQAQYDKSLESYHSAEIILNEIAFPTEVIREMIQKVQEKKKQHQIQKQKELESSIQKEKEEWEFQRNIADEFKKESGRLQTKQVQLEEMEKLKEKLELTKQDAFKILDAAEELLKNFEYDKAIESYRKAELILNELHFPTDSIKGMVTKVQQLMKQKEEMQEFQFQREIEKIQEEKDLQLLIEERQGQEREKKKAQLLALQERERIVQEQASIRESAYSMLDEAGKYLKQLSPDYTKAISLYIEARNLLADNIGWEPEINNLNALIKDLQQEQVSFQEKKRLEEQTLIQRQKEYEVFQKEIKARRIEQEKLKREQERQYRELILSKRRMEEIRDKGLKLIDEGKKWAAYHDFERAYQNFETAKEKFKEIGWLEETKYIETEIRNTKELEKRVESEELKIQSIQEQLDKQRTSEESRRKAEEAQLKETIGEVSTLANEVINLIEERRKQQEIADTQKREEIKYEAKEFRRMMGDMIKIKEELIEELKLKENKRQEFQEKLQMAKEREEVDNLKRMIKEAEKRKEK